MISGSVCLKPPEGASLLEVSTAEEMREGVINETEKADALIMAAAVADYRPAQISKRKIKKDQGGLAAIELEETSDILNEVAKRKKTPRVGPLVTIGFAAETENLKENAKLKLDKKNLDLIAANDVSHPGRFWIWYRYKPGHISVEKRPSRRIATDGKI